MARIRSIKPEFFMHEALAELTPAHRLLFIGLWTLADREGRLEDRPKRIKASLFPWDDVDVDAMLNDLQRIGVLVRYAVDGQACIAIPSFGKHQRPNTKEAASTLPEPPEHPSSTEKNVPSTKRNVPGTEGNGASTLGREDGEGEGEGEEESTGAGAPGLPVQEPLLAPEPGEDALRELWNAEAHPDLPRWREMPKGRRTAAKARLRERPLSGWREIIRRISASPFCRGENDRGWRADPDWLLKPGTAARVLEGKYDPPPERNQGPPGASVGRGAVVDCRAPRCNQPGSTGAGLCPEHLEAFRATPEFAEAATPEARIDALWRWLEASGPEVAA